MKVEIEYGPTYHRREQGAVASFGGRLQDVLAELCISWPDGWDKYVSL